MSNVLDQYKELTTAEARQEREQKVLPYSVVLMNLTGDFNKSTAIRNANNFLATEVALVGNKHWDRRGAVGTHNYMRVVHYSTLMELIEDYNKKYDSLAIIGIENNVAGAEMLHQFEWPEAHVVMLFGEEQRGLSAAELALCDAVVYIPTMGTVRSLNVGVASGIIMYDYCEWNNDLK